MSKKNLLPISHLNLTGINPSRVINKDYLKTLDEIYKCPICNNIMINPTDCVNCGHSFCYDCIVKSECPFKCKNKNIKISSMGIKTLLNKLIFKCENKGCKEEIPYLNVRSHDQICGFKIITCPNEKCGKKLCMKDLEEHIKNECKFALKTCKFCKFQFLKDKIKNHEEICNKAYKSLTGDRSINIEKIDTKQYLEALTMNINRILRDNGAKSFLNERISYESDNDNDNENNNENNDNNNNSIYKENSIVINEDLKNSIKKEISSNIKDNLNNVEKNIDDLNDRVDEIKNLITTFKSLNKDIKNETNIELSNIQERENKEIAKDIIEQNYNYIEKLIKKLEKSIKLSLQNLNTNISNMLNINKNPTHSLKISNKQISIKNIETENIIEKQITNKIIKNGNTYVQAEYFNNKLDNLIRLIHKTNLNIEGFKVSFTSDIQQYTENLEKIISITATTEQVITEVEIEEILDEEGKVIEKREIIKDPNKKSYRSLSFIHLNEKNFKDLQNNIMQIVDENNKRNFEQMKIMYEKEIEERKKEDDDYFVFSDDEEIDDILKQENIIEDKGNNDVKRIKKDNLTNYNNNLIESLEENKECLKKENEKIIEQVKNNNETFKNELKNNISIRIDKFKKDIGGINLEINTLKSNIKEIMTKMNEEFLDLTKLIKEKEDKKINEYKNTLNQNINIEIKKSETLNEKEIEYSNDNLKDKNIEIPIEKKDENKKESNYLKSKRKYKLSKRSKELRSGPSNDEIVKSIEEETPEFEQYSDNEKDKNIITEKIIEENEEDKNYKKHINEKNEITENKNIYLTENIKEENENKNDLSINDIDSEENNSINKFSILLSSLQKELNNLTNLTDKVPSIKKYDDFKDSIVKEYDKKLPIFGKEIEENLKDKMTSMFSLKWCNQCEKVDYFYGFLPCYICNKDNCKNCIILCSQCKHLTCKTCGLCPKCLKKICINCRQNQRINSCDKNC